MTLGLVLAFAGDWLGIGGDAQHSGWQRHGKRLTAANARDLKLLWKKSVDQGSNGLAAPVILGPTITHRGVRELVLVGGASDNFYAYDADLGTLFWKRHFESDVTATPCGSGSPAPVIETDPEADMSDAVNDDEDNDDEPDAMRPVDVTASDGRLHTLRPSDGADMSTPLKFLPPHARASGLNFGSDVVYAVTRGDCEGMPEGIWAIDAKAPAATANHFGAKFSSGVSVGDDGGICTAVGEKLVSLSADLQLKHSFTASGVVTLPPLLFQWQGREVLAAGWKHGIMVLDAAHLSGIAKFEALSDEFAGLMATWQDPAGVRWIYATAQGRMVGFKLTGTATHAKLQRVWESRSMTAPGPPVITHGVVFTLASGPDHATLFALDAATGGQLYTTGDAVRSKVNAPDLALANGHVCFTTADDMLYCFGIPIEQQ
jgi:outer membrane protein assembly factor BamB